tara:strand:+ start:7107 stop:8828 length:1722 start_codon:yes stop_codon:yes gene_type:complete
MSFNQLNLLPLVIVGLVIFWLATLRAEKKYYQWVLDHWFFKQSLLSKVSSIFYFLGFTFLLLALLDLRGKEQRVTGKSVDQKTVVLIDASASMLAEDVRPNRFEKATLLAKHFIKKAVGHQVSVVVFSDGQKRIVPFTKDMDLVEARLNTLKELDLDRGGTGLSMALQESIQYFINSEQRPFGNILVITDAEETDGGLNLNVPDGISVAIVGVGTAKGAPIPIRNSRGVFRGNKKFKGETVISKLDETFLKKLGEKIKHFQYWVASSYSLPTEQILNFFSRSYKTKKSEDDFRIKPVLANYLLLPGVFMLILAFVMKNGKSFAVAALLICSMDSFGNNSPPEPQKNEVILELEERFARNELGPKGKKKLASELLRQGFSEEATTLYKEVLPETITDENSVEKFNLGAAQLKAGKVKDGLKTYTELVDYLENNTSENNLDLLEKSKLNMLKAIQTQTQKKKQQNKNSKSKEEKGKNQENKDKDQGEGQSKDQKDQKGQGQGNKKDKKKNEDKSDQEKNQKKERDKKDGKGESGKNEKQKVPSILKQLLSDDNQLQKKVIDANTVKGKARDKKDW